MVISTAAFHARVRGSVPGLGGLKETKNVSSPSTCESQYCGEQYCDVGPTLYKCYRNVLCLLGERFK